jgi:hypothetical protein
MQEFINFKDNRFTFFSQFASAEKYSIKDNGYREFITTQQDGFYFSKALHIYGHSIDTFHDIEAINNIFRNAFSFLGELDLIAFACDLFGNQFCFRSTDIVFFNLETCETELLAGNFHEWTDIILNDCDYYTGEQILKEWEEIMLPLKVSERFIPRKPFVIGGEYSPKNMIAIDFFKALEYNGSIAEQIFNLPDGAKITLKTTLPNSELGPSTHY